MTSYTSEILVGSAIVAAAALGVAAYVVGSANCVHQLFCFVDGEMSYFSVKIRLDATVDELKKEIKTQKQPDLDSFAADNLKLFPIHVPIGDKSKLPGQIAALKSLKEMNPERKLSDYYSAPLPERAIHVLVKPPIGGK
jgi:hypothetical protein